MPKVTKKCEQCEKEFVSYSGKNIKFCSRRCMGIHNQKKLKKPCLDCGKIFEYYKRNNRPDANFCSKICASKSLRKTGIIKTCNECNKLFKAKGNHSKFCSVSCGAKFRSKVNRIIIKCLRCEKEFSVTNYTCYTKKRRYCSPKCGAETFSLKACEYCAQLFHLKPSRTKSGLGKYCSMQCSSAAKIKINSQSRWIKLSKKLFGNKCQKCGIDNTQIECHHLDGNNQNNPENGSNWMRLCTKCHQWSHKMARTITRYLTREEILGIVPIGKKLKKVKEDPKQMSLF